MAEVDRICGRGKAFDGLLRVDPRVLAGLEGGSAAASILRTRPKIVGSGQQAADLLTAEPGDHGTPGLVNLLGIESHSLTAAMAVVDHVLQLT